ncbi:hypothetical protein CEN40_24335 [Fischerella thermalis CCMEE 5205]|nr:hypothetical protein CEN40_24335 [Fischerella thermalis CCMEE 5205]
MFVIGVCFLFLGIFSYLLPKSRGKTVLVITYDDQYFHIADRIIKLEYGKVKYDKSPALLNI